MQMKQRHGCLTAWLVLIIVANALVGVAYLATAGTLTRTGTVPGWAIPVLILLSLANVGLAIALFMWKRWGFYGFVATSLIALVVNLAIGLSVAQAVFGLVGVAVLYGVLQIGNVSNKGWPQLD
jgi:hypothetical protein